MVTEEERYGEIARRDFRWMLDYHEQTLAVGAQDQDTWIYAAPLTRRCIALDWLWDRGALSASEQSDLAGFFIEEALKYSRVVLDHRVPPHANNQGLAMALHGVVTGWLFGVRRARDARAQELLRFALPHLHQQIALLPPGGYSGEGSTYIFQVADPLMAIACAVLEEISGKDYYHRELWPSGNSVAQVIELDAKLIPPSGLLPAWDQHGYHLKKSGTACAFVAHRTGNPEPYAHFLHGPGWEFSEGFAWMRDDHVWQWIWMPDPVSASCGDAVGQAAEFYPRSWAEERVAGALLSTDHQLHLFQMWDLSSPRPVRLHMNPNSLLLEAWGSPLTVDGNAAEGFPLAEDERMQFLNQYSTNPKMESWAAGSLAAHSVIWVDGRIDVRVSGGGYENFPGQTPTGCLLRREERDGFQLLAVDCAAFYRHTTDMVSIIRNSALIDDSFWVILDQVETESLHTFTWQLVLRAGAQRTEYGARLVTAEHVVLDVIHLDAAPQEFHDIPGYPSLLEGRCHHVRKHLSGRRVEFLTVLVPQSARRCLADWTPPGLDEVYYSEKPVHLTRRCPIPPGTSRLLIELPRPRPMRLWLDQEELLLPRITASKDGEQQLTPLFIEIPPALRSRQEVELTLEIAAEGRTGMVGGVRLHEVVEVARPSVEKLTDERYRVCSGAYLQEFDLSELRTSSSRQKAPALMGEDPLVVAGSLLDTLPLAPDAAAPLLWEGTSAERGQACVLAAFHPLEQVEPFLLQACGDVDWLVRMLAIRSLGRIYSRNAVPLLRQILAEETADRINDPGYAPKYRIAESCILALQDIGDPTVVSDFIRLMGRAGFYGIRRLLPGALEKFGDPIALPVLREWAEDPDGETADACRRAIQKLEARQNPDLSSLPALNKV
ncbi:MAG: HEAT repeat domain-containing protein [Candidatus Competibacteraceae bacterium]|nr:HEAT repeat domain-containing protein [Candidatus Competibacteraceae bacterium]